MYLAPVFAVGSHAVIITFEVETLPAVRTEIIRLGGVMVRVMVGVRVCVYYVSSVG